MEDEEVDKEVDEVEDEDVDKEVEDEVEDEDVDKEVDEVEYEEVDNRTRHNSRSGSSFTQRGVAMACCGALNFFYCIIAGVRHPQYKCNTLQYLTISSHAILWHRNPAAIGQTSIIPIQYLAIFSCVMLWLSNQYKYECIASV